MYILDAIILFTCRCLCCDVEVMSSTVAVIFAVH